MLAIRMKRTGRKGHAQFRVVVQDSRLSPSSGRVVAFLGSYNPHTKSATLDAEKAATYLGNGAQPSDRVAKLFEKEGIELPGWVKTNSDKKRAVRNPEKLRRNQPKQEAAPDAEATEAPVEETAVEVADTPAEESKTETEEAAA